METNLRGVKEMAKLLTEYPIQPSGSAKSGLGSIFLSHPIYRDRIVAMPTEKTEENPVGLDLLDITLLENQPKIIEMYKHAIDKQKDAFGVFMIINKPYSGFFFKLVKDYLSTEDYTLLLENLWTSMEYPNSDKNVSKKEWISFWKKADLSLIYNNEDLELLAGLPEEFYVYRGLMERAKLQALSWTLDIGKATWFAKRFGHNGKVYKAKCKKKDILVYLSCRGESEIVVDWKKLKDIEEVSYI